MSEIKVPPTAPRDEAIATADGHVPPSQVGGSSKPLSPVGWIAAAVIVAVALAVVLVIMLPFASTVSLSDRRWFAHGVALAGMAGIALVFGAVRRYAVNVGGASAGASLRGILVGEDNRLSTSKLSAFAWTWVIAWAILSLAVADWVGAPSGWTAFVDEGLQDKYLILLGGPFVALVSAKALVQARTESGTQVKAPAPDGQTVTDRISQAFSDDTGQTDLVDSQYLAFGMLTVVIFVVMFLREDLGGLPDLPDLLVGLSSVGATTYVANKFTATDAPPHIDRVVPNRAVAGDTVVIYGRNLIKASQGGRRGAASGTVEILFGAIAQQAVAVADNADVRSSPSGNDVVTIVVPQPPSTAFAVDESSKEAPLSIRNHVGVLSDNEAPFTLVRS